jgi:hypothetical protein
MDVGTLFLRVSEVGGEANGKWRICVDLSFDNEKSAQNFWHYQLIMDPSTLIYHDNPHK